MGSTPHWKWLFVPHAYTYEWVGVNSALQCGIVLLGLGLTVRYSAVTSPVAVHARVCPRPQATSTSLFPRRASTILGLATSSMTRHRAAHCDGNAVG